jgi:hypothetical protein
VLFDAARPVILNGIEDIVTRPDLADRAVFLTLEPIPEERRRPEQELWAAFEAERPRILGVLLDAVAKGLAMLPQTKLEKLPRMADFALWATACETALWPAGTFWPAYCGNRDVAVEGVIDADPIAAAVRGVMAARTEWTGTASDLLGALAEVAGERVAKSKTWPDSPRALAGRLRRAAAWRKWGPSDPTLPHWYDEARLARIMAAYIAHDEDHDLPGRTVRAFVSEFRGLSGTAKARDICEAVGASRLSLAEFYGDEEMRNQSRPIKPRDLGLIGAEHLRAKFKSIGVASESFCYKRAEGPPRSQLGPRLQSLAPGRG